MKHRAIPRICLTALLSLTALLALVGCADNSSASSAPEAAISRPEESRPGPSSGPEASRPSESSPLSTGDYGAFLQFLRSARTAQVFRLREDRSGYDPLGRINGNEAFAALYDVFSCADCAPLESFDFGAEGLIWLSGVTGPDDRPGDIWIAPLDGGAALLFEIDGVLPNQRFFLSADMTSLLLQLLDPWLDASASGLLDGFCAALEAGDPAALARLTGGNAAAYAPLADTEILCGGWQPREGFEGQYILSLDVRRGGGLLPEGEAEWLVRLGPTGGDGGLGVTLAAPLELVGADESAAGSPAVELIGSVNLVFGAEPFGSPEDLNPGLLCEAVLVQVKKELHPEDDLYVFPGEEVRAIAAARFGLERYSGEGLACYDPETDEFSLYGRGAAEVFDLLSAGDDGEGTLRVTQRVYADPACIVPEKTLLYVLRLSSGPDGCTLLSCEEIH